MNTKVLIETLTEIPDLSLLTELQVNLEKNETIIVPDIRKLFTMFSSLLMTTNKPIIIKAFLLMSQVNQILLVTQLEICWQYVSRSLICLLGQEDAEIRKKAKHQILQFLNISKNSFMVLEKLYYEGLENESFLVMVNSIKLIFKILEEYSAILSNKSSIHIVKLILEKIIRLTSKDHQDLRKNAKQFLDRLFFMKIINMDEVLQRMDSFYVGALEKLWEGHKEAMIYKDQSIQSIIHDIKYEHLPIIKDLIFGVYEPFTFKHIFNPESKASNKFAIRQFKELFFSNEEKLTKYINIISKIIFKVLPEKHLEILQLFHHIIHLPGITNIINMNDILPLLIQQLDQPHVPYRKQLRECLKRLHFVYRNSILKHYEIELQKLEAEHCEHQNWVKIYEIFCLVSHWVENAESATQCYPPTLDYFVAFNAKSVKMLQPKAKAKCMEFMFETLDKYPAYRETLEEMLGEQDLGQLEDEIQNRRNAHNLALKENVAAKQTFVKEYHEERNRFIETNQK